MRRYGFTLIELLIVVAIIAILAAIAVPNFLEAQTRAKVSRAAADMRTLSTALETYQIDHNKPMSTVVVGGGALTGPSLVNSALTGNGWVSYRFLRLTTPIAYMNSVLADVFAKDGKTKNVSNYDTFDYVDSRLSYPGGFTGDSSGTAWRGAGLTSGGNYRMSSAGPDNFQAFGGSTVGAANSQRGVDYDATNGTISTGDIVRVGGAGPLPASAANQPAINRVTGQVNDPALK